MVKRDGRKELYSREKLVGGLKKSLEKNPNYVNSEYRKEQLWGEKLQTSTEILLNNDQLKEDVMLAKSKINEPS